MVQASRQSIDPLETVVDLFGGLGNQLFQISFAESLEGYGHKVTLNTAFLKESELSKIRGLLQSLTHLVVDVGPIPFTVRLSRILKVKASLQSRIARRAKIILPPEAGTIEFDERGSTNWRYHGYFQNFDLSINFARVLKFYLGSQFSDSATNFLAEFGTKRKIAVHIRLGDYLKIGGIYGPLGPAYFDTALKQITAELGTDFEILVFSNGNPLGEPGYEFLDQPNVWMVNQSNLFSDFDEMFLMSKCEILVIANSTFSWWAAVMSDDARVMYPDPWFRGLETPPGLIPKSWRSHSPHWR